jgi:hypothetical protein
MRYAGLRRPPAGAGHRTAVSSPADSFIPAGVLSERDGQLAMPSSLMATHPSRIRTKDRHARGPANMLIVCWSRGARTDCPLPLICRPLASTGGGVRRAGGHTLPLLPWCGTTITSACGKRVVGQRVRLRVSRQEYSNRAVVHHGDNRGRRSSRLPVGDASPLRPGILRCPPSPRAEPGT